MKYVLSIDQSTQSTKAVLFDEQGKLLQRADKKHKQIVDENGYVSHDPIEIYENTLYVIRQVVAEAGIHKDDVACLGISNQRETTVMWDKEGKPLADAVVWQCSRAKDIAEQYKDSSDRICKITGTPLSPYFPACKMKWLINHTVHGDEYCLGTIDTWLIYNLTYKKEFKTDASNASRTQLYDLHTGTWSEELCALFGIPKENLPEICDSNACFGSTDADGFFDKPIPIMAVLGDSHAALYGQGCHSRGQVKTTLGTGSSIMMNIGTEEKHSTNGLTTSLAWSIDGVREYVLEGNINYAGAVITWLQDDLHLIEGPQDTVDAVKNANPMDETVLVPAFTGLGAPYWVNDAKAMFCGMSRTTKRNELIKAAVESIAFQITDVLNAMTSDSGLVIKQVKTDGGPSKNQYLMQFLADTARTTVCASTQEELSAIGAAYLAGIHAGIYQKEKIFAYREYSEYHDSLDSDCYQKRMDRWSRAVHMLKNAYDSREGE